MLSILLFGEEGIHGPGRKYRLYPGTSADKLKEPPYTIIHEYALVVHIPFW